MSEWIQEHEVTLNILNFYDTSMIISYKAVTIVFIID